MHSSWPRYVYVYGCAAPPPLDEEADDTAPPPIHSIRYVRPRLASDAGAGAETEFRGPGSAIVTPLTVSELAAAASRDDEESEEER